MRAPSGVGIGFRPELAAALLADPGAVGFVEVVAEACREPRVRREMAALAEIWPVVPHGVKLSLGSAEGICEARAKELGDLVRALRAPVVSEHVAFVRAGDREIGHLTEMPLTRHAVRVVARNVAALRRALPDVPLLLENVARAGLFKEAEMTEGEFYAEIANATGCELLLDVGNLYANARNAGLDPRASLREHPLDRVAMIHVAGGVEQGGFYFDTHAHPVPDAVFDLVGDVLAARGPVPVLLERDGAFEDTRSLLAEVAHLWTLVRGAEARGREHGPAREGGSWSEGLGPRSPRARDASSGSGDLAIAQAAIARALTDPGPSSDPAVRRAREVLERKRADDALPLLPELSRRLPACEARSLGRIAEVPRLPSMTAVADAMRIASAARGVPALAPSATRDALLLRARFVGGPSAPRPRVWPFVVRAKANDGGAVWALKGFGTRAEVRMLDRGDGR